jgi:hypothetical protein
LTAADHSRPSEAPARHSCFAAAVAALLLLLLLLAVIWLHVSTCGSAPYAPKLPANSTALYT